MRPHRTSSPASSTTSTHARKQGGVDQLAAAQVVGVNAARRSITVGLIKSACGCVNCFHEDPLTRKDTAPFSWDVNLNMVDAAIQLQNRRPRLRHLRRLRFRLHQAQL
jgi:hypothetical protein